jgi:hypothetical protein
MEEGDSRLIESMARLTLPAMGAWGLAVACS